MAKVRDRNRIPEALRQLARLKSREARVGVFADAPNLVNIAQLNEFGADIPVTPALARRLRALADEHGVSKEGLPREGDRLRIPERSFLRSTADESASIIANATPEAVQSVMLGEKDAYEVLIDIGKLLQEAIVERVASGEGLAPNDPFTVAIKGHNRPLIGKTGVFETTQGIRVQVVRRE